jgi:hypothetical protein
LLHAHAAADSADVFMIVAPAAAIFAEISL